MTQKPSFKTRARIINQLGEQLIKNESIALLELIKNSYDAEAIEVLSGLDPVKKRPGMYTDTSNPNHLIQEYLQPKQVEYK